VARRGLPGACVTPIVSEVIAVGWRSDISIHLILRCYCFPIINHEPSGETSVINWIRVCNPWQIESRAYGAYASG